jgi:hypothetical protein
MKKNRNPGEEALTRGEDIFLSTCEAVLNALGPKPFHIRTGLNAAAFDAVMVAFSNHLTAIPEDIRSRYIQLTGDEEFDKSTRQATTDVETVRQRFVKAETLLFG